MVRKLGVDIDGCLANFTAAYARLLIREAGDKLPEGWQTNPEFPDTWYWDRQAGYTTETESTVWKRDIIAHPTYWEGLDALAYATETIGVLNRLAKVKAAEVYFLTHRMGNNPKRQTERWLYRHGMEYPTVILVENKAPLLDVMGLDFFVDDKPTTLTAVADMVRNGGAAPLRDHIYAVDYAYNREGRHEDVKAVANVKEALEREGLW